MIPTNDQLKTIAIGERDENVASVIAALALYGERTGLTLPHRLGQYIPQLLHESGDFRYDREIWGPTEAQRRYDTRTDLGNTPAADGDGYLYLGRSGIQITGKHNYRRFTEWVKEFIDLSAPDFVAKPDAINTDPWEGLVPIWYWHMGNPEGKSLNRYCDDPLEANTEMITRRINGGLNGYPDRLVKVTRTGLVFLGYAPDDVKGFQSKASLAVDGIAGPATRKAIHQRLFQMKDSVLC